MPGSASFLHALNRQRLIVVAIAAAVALSIGFSALAPSVAHASGCTDSWTNTEGGSWFTGSDWSKGAPPTSEEEACITANGTYTVTMTQTSGTVSLQSLTVGGTSGTQTLAVGSSCSVNAILATTAGISNGAQGAITLTNGDGCGDSVTLSGPIANAGTITSELAHGGSRTLEGNLTNTGTLAIDTSTAYNGSGTLLKNEGAIDLAEAKQLTVSSKAALENGAGGSIAATGSGDVLMSSTTFTEGAGTTSGTQPVIVDDGTLSYTGKGKSLIALRGSSALSGNLGSEQSLSIESTCSENVVATAGGSFKNAGTITLTNGDGCGDSATLTLSAGTLTSSGKIVTEPANGGTRTLQGNITNTGTLTIKANTAYNGAGALLTNEGALDISEGIQLTVSNGGAFTNGSGGKIVAMGSADVLMDSGTAFSEGAGTTSGTKPVIVDDGTLTYTGTGASAIALHGSDVLAGSVAAGQSLSIESTCSENVVATAAEGFTNAGTITLTNGDGCGNNATLTVSAGTLTNSGKIAVEPASGGTRTLQGNIVNTGTLAIKANTAYNGAIALLTNEGALNLSEGVQLTVSNGGAFTNGGGGVIAATGSADLFMDPGTAFSEGAGTTSGTKPVIVDDGTLTYTGAGASAIALHGSSSLAGSVAAGQSLSIESTCSENVVATAAEGFTNAGTITLTNGDGCGNNATLTVSAGTLTNSGKIVVEPAHGGSRTLQGNLTNTSTGTIAIKASTAYNASGALLTNSGAINISEGTQLTVSNGGSVTNDAGGNIFGAGNGDLLQTGGTFTEVAGRTSGTEPVILDDGTLDYTGTSAEHGAGRIALRGTSTLNGDVRAGEELALTSTCSEHAVVSAPGSFFSAGKIELTNGDGCGNNATLNLKGGTLTNNGTLSIANPHGGLREIEGNLINNKTVLVAAGETLHVSGTYTQSSAGNFKVSVAESGFGSISVAGAATIAGTLVVRQVAPFKASLGQKFAILSGASLTGTFAKETEDQINGTGLYYEPTYSTTGVTLAAAQATLSLSASSGLPGSTVTLGGSGYLPGDTITPTFTDHKGVLTTFPTVTTNSSGEFSTEITIPVSAAVGNGRIKVTSTMTGVHIADTFKVT